MLPMQESSIYIHYKFFSSIITITTIIITTILMKLLQRCPLRRPCAFSPTDLIVCQLLLY